MPSRLWFAFVFLVVSAVFSGAHAQDAQPVATPWQDVITGQVQAFRDHDAPAALSFAGAGFQTRFKSPEEFFVAIMGSGYAPIMESRSHTFGPFQKIDDKTVAQQVRFSGADQRLYEAVYVLVEEEGGWRVQGVQLAKTEAVGI
jgi:hypothetical protein